MVPLEERREVEKIMTCQASEEEEQSLALRRTAGGLPRWALAR